MKPRTKYYLCEQCGCIHSAKFNRMMCPRCHVEMTEATKDEYVQIKCNKIVELIKNE